MSCIFFFTQDRISVTATIAEKKAAEESFKLVGEAYSILSDMKKREMYDREIVNSCVREDETDYRRKSYPSSKIGLIAFVICFVISFVISIIISVPIILFNFFKENKSTFDILVNFLIFIYYAFSFCSNILDDKF